MPMPRRKRQLPTVQLDLLRASSSQSPDWRCLSAEVREKVTRLIARMLSQAKVCDRPDHSDGGGDDE